MLSAGGFPRLHNGRLLVCGTARAKTIRTRSRRGSNPHLLLERETACPISKTRASTHGWIRTTTDAINSRALYRLSYVGNDALSRVDSNHELPESKSGVLPIELRLRNY